MAPRLGLAAVSLGLLVAAVGAWAQGYIPGNAVRVNGVEISNERFNAFYQEYRRPYGISVAGRGDHLNKLIKLRKEAMDLMIEQELVRQAAEGVGIDVTEDEIDAAIAEISAPFDDPADFDRRLQSEGFTEESYRQHVGRMIAAKRYLDTVRMGVGEVSDEALEAYYRDNELRLTFPEEVRVRHILLTWKPLGTPDDRAAIREQIASAVERGKLYEVTRMQQKRMQRELAIAHSVQSSFIPKQLPSLHGFGLAASSSWRGRQRSRL